VGEGSGSQKVPHEKRETRKESKSKKNWKSWGRITRGRGYSPARMEGKKTFESKKKQLGVLLPEVMKPQHGKSQGAGKQRGGRPIKKRGTLTRLDEV